MKIKNAFIPLTLILINFVTAYSQVGIKTTNPKASLHIKESNVNNPENTEGLIIPRINNFPVTNPTIDQNGMLVFLNTDNSFYFWDNNNNSWKKLRDSNTPTIGWETRGNAGTVAGTDFLGTTDNAPLDIRTNDVIRARITTNGRIEIFNTNNSVIIGEQAGNNLDATATNNTLIGYQAGRDIVGLPQRNNTMVGDRAGTHTTNRDNSFFGQGSGYQNTTGRNNTFVGRSAGENNTIGSYNTYLGFNAGVSSPNNLTNASAVGNNAQVTNSNSLVLGGTGADAVSVGIGITSPNAKLHIKGETDTTQLLVTANANQSNSNPLIALQKNDGTTILEINSDNENNTFIGLNAGNANNQVNALYNTFVGSNSGADNTNGFVNSFFGHQAGYHNTTGNFNSFFGAGSGKNHLSGEYNVFVGSNSGHQNLSGSNNVFVGDYAGRNNTGSQNTYIGQGAGYNNINGNSNIFIGRGSGSLSSGSNKLYIENSDSNLPLIYGEFDNDMISINGKLGVQNISPKAILDATATDVNNPNNTDGILIPRLNNFPITNPTANQNGMLVFLNTDNNFYYWNNANGNWIKLETNNNKHYVGEFFGGGIVAYTYDNGKHGLILSLEDLSPTGVSWGDTTITTGAVSEINGVINTNTILSTGGATATDAAGLCDSYSFGGFTDWYLPASWEFFNIFSNAYAINKILENDGNPSTTGIYHPGKYWTSTEIAGDGSSAYTFLTYSNYTLLTLKSSNIPRVRAVREF